MLYFCFGILISYCFVSTFLVIKLYKKNKMKCTKEEIEDYLLDNLLEVDINV